MMDPPTPPRADTLCFGASGGQRRASSNSSSDTEVLQPRPQRCAQRYARRTTMSQQEKAWHTFTLLLTLSAVWPKVDGDDEAPACPVSPLRTNKKRRQAEDKRRRQESSRKMARQLSRQGNTTTNGSGSQRQAGRATAFKRQQ